MLAGLVILAWITLARAETARVWYVHDGDTFRLTTGERIRLAGIDTPEIQRGQARCAAEIERGRQATRQVRAMIDGQAVGIERVGRSYNRSVARVRLADGRDLSAELVRLGFARLWPRHAPKPDWCGS